jgi:negative regulator of sigma E activity
MEKISRLMDGDVPQNELTATLRTCGGDGREAWQMYHLIGDALRGELTHEKSGENAQKCAAGIALSGESALYSRICAAIADEPNVFVPAVAQANKAQRERNLAPLAAEGSEIPAAQIGPISAQNSDHVESVRGRWLNVGNGAAVWKPWAIAATFATSAIVGWQTLVTQPRELAAAKAQQTTTAAAQTPAAGVMSSVMPAGSMNRYLNAHSEAAPVTRLSGPRVYIQPVANPVTH